MSDRTKGQRILDIEHELGELRAILSHVSSESSETARTLAPALRKLDEAGAAVERLREQVGALAATVLVLERKFDVFSSLEALDA